MQVVGEQIKLARLRRNLSVAQVAERATCSPLTVSRIEKGKLTVWHPDVKEPVKVKYCIEDYCKGNIYNGAGQPAYPFEAEVRRP